MKRLTLAVAALFAIAAGYIVVTNRPPAEVRVALAQPKSAEGTYRLRSTDVAASCDVTRGDELSAGRSKLTVDPSCASVVPGVEKARYWLEKADGSVSFTENGVDPIVTFGIADGVAYESLQPSTPVISLDADVNAADMNGADLDGADTPPAE